MWEGLLSPPELLHSGKQSWKSIESLPGSLTKWNVLHSTETFQCFVCFCIQKRCPFSEFFHCEALAPAEV